MGVSTEKTIRLESKLSGADLSAKQGYGAKVSGTTYVLATASTCVGAIINGGSESGSRVEVGVGEVKELVSAAAIAVGDYIRTDANGAWIVATSAEIYNGVATKGCASGYKFNALLSMGKGAAVP